MKDEFTNKDWPTIDRPTGLLPDHWVTKEFGFKVYLGSRDIWMFVRIGGYQFVKVIPEFLEDKDLARFELSLLKRLHVDKS